MQSTIETEPQPDQTIRHDAVSIDSLCESMRTATSDRRAWKLAADWFARAFDAQYVLIEVDGRTGTSTITSPLCPNENWQPLCDALLLKSRQNVETVSRSVDGCQCAVAAPMSTGDSGAAVGGVALAIETISDEHTQARCRELLAYVRLCESAVKSRSRREPADRKSGVSMQQGVSQAGSYESLHQYAFAITNGLQAKFGCDEVAIGMLYGARVRILSVSGMDSLHPRSPGSQLMQQAMEEAADADECVVSPGNDAGTNLIDLPLHHHWRTESGSTGVASLPLRHGDEIVGVVSLRRTDGRNFTAEEVTQITSLVAPLASGLMLLDQANRSLATHAKDSCGQLRNKWRGLQNRTRYAVAIGLVVAVGWLLLGKTTHTVQTPCEVVAGEPIQLAAPFEGHIIASHVQPGDFVRAGQPLVEFDTKALLSEYRSLQAELRMSEITVVDALAMRDVAVAGRARNEANAARAKLKLVNQQMSQAILTAPFDGFVLEGDTNRRIGETLAVGTEILQLAAADKLSVELRVGEANATYVDRGMSGEFSTLARPGEAWKCEVDRIDATGTVIAGENVFVARANPQTDTPGWLRPGMQGLAKIDAGRQPVWWVYLHGVTDWISMQAWKL